MHHHHTTNIIFNMSATVDSPTESNAAATIGNDQTVQAGPRGAIAKTNAQDMLIAPRGNMDNHNKYADSPAGSDQEVDENKSLEVSDDFGC